MLLHVGGKNPGFPHFQNRAMFSRSCPVRINYMRLHNRKTSRQYSAEYGKVWTKEIIPRTEQDIQLYGWFHNYPYHNQNDLTWWADRRRPRHTVANYALASSSCSIFADLLKSQEESVVHQLSLGGGTTLLLPTNSAFSAFSLSELQTNPKACREFLLSYVVLGELNMRSIALRCKQSKDKSVGVKSVSGKVLSIKMSGSLERGNRELKFGDAKVTTHGIKCSNGVVLVLDGLV